MPLHEWPKADIKALTDLYKEKAIPSDQIASNQKKRREFCNAFNERVEARYGPDMIVDKLIRLRKTGLLPRVARPKKDK